jgi:hypothetical protein
MFPVKITTNKTHPQIQGMSVNDEKKYLLNLDLTNLDPLSRYVDKIEILKALGASNHLKRYYQNTMDSLDLANAIDGLDAFISECVERKKLTIVPSLNNPYFDDSLDDGDYLVETTGEGHVFLSIARFHQNPIFVHSEYLGRHLSSIPYHWTGKAGFSDIHLDDCSILRIIEKEPSLSGLRSGEVVGWQLDRILEGKAILTPSGYKERLA